MQPQDLILNIADASTMWSTLKKQYSGAGEALKETYFKEIIAIDYSMFSDIMAFIVRYKKLYS